MNRALLILALGLALALLAVWVGAIIYAVHAGFPEKCGSNGCMLSYPLWVLNSAILPTTFVMQSITRNMWIARVERACGIWQRHRRAVVNFSSLCYIRKPGVSAERAVQAIQRFARVSRPPAAPGCLITLLAYTPFLLLLPGLLALSAWLGQQWVWQAAVESGVV
ncbi:MAG TPA: hypothetical protein VIG30_19090 [Ktedonobacterales bacterium]